VELPAVIVAASPLPKTGLSLASLSTEESGAPLREPGPCGEQLIDSSFLFWLNSADEPLEMTLPANEWVQTGEVVLSTDDANPVGTPVKAGQDFTLGGRAVLVVRST
jgi:glycogen operon protein